MPTIEIQVRRFSIVSSRSFEEIVRRLTATIGHPDMNAFHSALTAARTVADLEEVVQGAIGSSSSALTPAKFCVRNAAGKGPRSSVSSSVIRSS